MSSIRVGIDVGGTFTHAVAFDLAKFELLGAHKVPTTHTASEGVGLGIVQALEGLLAAAKLAPSAIGLIAHSTTQATNALLEGDTAKVGILAMGGGLLGWRAREETAVPPLALAPGKVLETLHAWVSTDDRVTIERLAAAFAELARAGAEVFVAAEAFGVDDPAHEERAVTLGQHSGRSVTAASALSQTYGLRLRTRTACVNASILPRMMAAATMTEASVKELWKRQDGGASPPVMIMRSDGGIMGIDEMRRRPILTILSGPAAGVAAALRYSRVSDGIFLEIGGTSTDISVIKDGRSRHRAAVVGGHSLHLKTLDVRTVGVAGGSLALAEGTSLLAVGPRSAHIAGVRYAAFTPGLSADEVRPHLLRPDARGPGWWCFRRGDAPELYAVTPTCAANLLGLVPEGVEARGDVESVREALKGLAPSMNGGTPEYLAEELLARGVAPIERVVRAMIADYQLDRELVRLVGGGGGAWAWVPYLAKKMGMKFEVVDHAPVISAIGCATGLLREALERSIINPTEADVLAARREVVEKLVSMGGARETIHIEVDVDPRKNILRVVGTGSTEMLVRSKETLPRERLSAAAAEGLKLATPPHFVGSTDSLSVYECGPVVRLVDNAGVIRLQRRGGHVLIASAGTLEPMLEPFLEEHATFGDSGKELPELFLVYRENIVDLSGLTSARQIAALVKAELEGLPPGDLAFAVATPR